MFRRQDFESSTVIESTSEDVGGVLSLDEWKKAEKLKQRRSELESLGLSQEQIAYYFTNSRYRSPPPVVVMNDSKTTQKKNTHKC
jgi:hypothetical protein